MEIRMKVQLSGSRNGVDWPRRGEVIDLPVDEVESMVRNGYAEKVEHKEERAVMPPKGVEVRTAPKKGLSTKDIKKA